jgi:calcineurin-like phosphoesterase family protein
MQRKGDAKANIEAARERYLEFFDEVHLDADDHVIELQGVRFAVSHYPYEGDHFTDDRFPELRPEDTGLPLLHGHVHKLWKFNGRQFNVGVDVNDFAPVSEHEVLAWSSTIPK